MVGEPAPGPQASAPRLGAPGDPSHSSSSTARAPGAAAAPAAAPPVAALNPQAGSAAAARHQALVIIGALLHLLLAVHQWRSQESGRLHAVALALATAALAAANVLFAGFCLRHRWAQQVQCCFKRACMLAAPECPVPCALPAGPPF